MRRFRVIGLGMVAFLFLTVVGIHIYAQVFRFRAEHLLAKLKVFQVEETPAAAILRLRSDYHSNVEDHGPCSEEHCLFSVELTEWESLISLTSNHPWTERFRYYLVRGLRFFALRLNYLSASLLVEHGKLRSLSVWLVPASYIEYGSSDEHGFLSSFSVRAGTVGNLRRWVSRPQVYEHPNLLVWKPSACTGCSGAINAVFTWQASRGELKRALNFDLSCITRVHDCRTPEEYLPGAAEVLKGDAAKKLVGMWGKMPCDARMARILGRDSDFVDLVRVSSVEARDDEFVIVDYDLVKTLKGKELMLSKIYHPKQLAVAVDQSNSGPPRRTRC